MDDKKRAIVDALYTWINRRPGLDPANYFCGGDWREDRRNYDSERRRILRQRNDALRLLRQVELIDSISADDLLVAFRDAFSGRLSCEVTRVQYTADTCPGRPCGDCCDHQGPPVATLNYCTGQYWPTEYRAAAAAVLASALWTWNRDKCMPSKIVKDGREYYPHSNGGANLQSAGDWLRASFRREFGAAFQKRYFD